MPPQGPQDAAFLNLLIGIFVQSSIILGGLGLISGIVLTAIALRRRPRRPRDIPSR